MINICNNHNRESVSEGVHTTDTDHFNKCPRHLLTGVWAHRARPRLRCCSEWGGVWVGLVSGSGAWNGWGQGKGEWHWTWDLVGMDGRA